MTPEQMERARERYRLLESPGFERELEELLQGLDLDVFDEDWQLATILNEAKEVLLGIRLDGDDAVAGRRGLLRFYDRKRQFFLALESRKRRLISSRV